MNRLLPLAVPRGAGVVALGAALLLATGCDSPSIPEGIPGTVEVRAFLDEDGSGTFTPGVDLPLADAPVTLEDATGAAVGQATTGSDGLATFPNVRPGGYTAVFGGTPPEGALLAGGNRPPVAIPAQGGTVQAAFRFVSQPGSIAGLVWRDVDGSGSYDPASDEVGENFRVELFQGNEAAGEPRAETLSDADGNFRFDFLRPGSWTLRVSAPPPLEVVGDPVRTVTVTSGGTTEVAVEFEGDLVLDIAQARELASGTPVTVEGVATNPQGTWNPREVMVQDETGGILVFVAFNQSPALEAGDRVRVSGTIGFFSGDVQITGNPTIEILGKGAPPAPRVITGEELLAGSYNGQLAMLASFVADSITGVDNFDNHNVFGTTGDGSTVVVRVDSRNGVASADWTVGVRYQVTGALRRVNGEPRIFPRSRADFFDLDGELGIAQVRTLPSGTAASVEGIVTVDQGAWGNRNVYVQDATGGILFFTSTGDQGLGLSIGDRVRVSGTVGFFNGEVQITGNPVIEVLGTGPVPDPRAVTGVEMLTRRYEGELVTLGAVTVQEIEVQNFDNHNVLATTADGSEVVIRVDSRTGVGSADWTVGGTFEVTGILRVFNGLPQLHLRRPADLVATGGFRAAESIRIPGEVK